jgi:integrase
MLKLRGTTWYLRVSVPLRVQPLFGRREVWRSLHTSDIEEAKVLSLKATAELRKDFARLEKKVRNPDPATVARDYQRKVLAADLAQRLASPPSDRADEGLSYHLTDLLEALENDPKRINRLLDRVLFEQGLHVPESQRPAFAHELLRKEVETLKTLLARTDGPFDATTSPDGGASTVEELLEAYISDRALLSKSEVEVRAAYRRFVGVVGNKLVKDVSKADVRAYRENLFTGTANRSEKALSPATIKKALGMISTIFRFGVGQGLVPVNPFDGGLTKVSRKAAQTTGRRPYTTEEVVTLLTAAGKLDGARKWLPWLAAYTGARIEELGGLRVQDMKRDGAVWYFDVQPTEERRLKNMGSARRVPVHPMLIQRGFVDYVQSVPKGGRLFPELRPGPHGVLTASFGKWYARFSDGCGIPDPRVTFHSWRHTFKTGCREAGVSEETHDYLTGHASVSVGRSYGRAPSLPVLAEAVSKIKYEGVALTA